MMSPTQNLYQIRQVKGMGGRAFFRILFSLFGEIYAKGDAFLFAQKPPETRKGYSMLQPTALYTFALGESDSKLKRRIPINDWNNQLMNHYPFYSLNPFMAF